MLAAPAAAQHAHEQMAKAPGERKLRHFSAAEGERVAALASVMIPSDEGPGAKEAGVVYFIDALLAGAGEEERAVYRAGLASTAVPKEGEPFFGMKKVEGISWQTLLADSAKAPAGMTVSVDRLQFNLEIFQKVCSAMSYAHFRKIIHRDLKPANVMLGRFGEVYVLDWGIARRFEAHSPTVVPTHLSGSPAYMAPEQAFNTREAGPPADVYSMGVVIHLCLTGRLPFEGESAAAILARVLTERARPIQSIAPVSFTLVSAAMIGAPLVSTARFERLERSGSRWSTRVPLLIVLNAFRRALSWALPIESNRSSSRSPTPPRSVNSPEGV